MSLEEEKNLIIFFIFPSAGPEEDSGDPGPGEETTAQAHIWSPTSTAPQEVKIQRTFRNGD